MHLRLVPDGAQGRPRPSRRRRTCGSLTPEERRALRAALRNLHRAAGSWSCLAAMLDVSTESIGAVASGRAAGSPGLALRVARLAGVPIDRVLTTALAPADICPSCGQRKAVA